MTGSERLASATTSWPAPGLARIRVRGEIDLSSAVVVRRELDRIIGQAPAEIRVDLAGTSFMGVAGLNVLLEAERSANTAGCRLRLENLSALLYRLFVLCGAGHMLA